MQEYARSIESWARPSATAAEPDPAFVDKLRSLGYVGDEPSDNDPSDR